MERVSSIHESAEFSAPTWTPSLTTDSLASDWSKSRVPQAFDTLSRYKKEVEEERIREIEDEFGET